MFPTANETSLLDQLLPLDLATRLLFDRIYGGRPDAPGVEPTRLDAMAALVSQMITVYTYHPARGEARKLSDDDLSGGIFRMGAQEFHYILGGHPPIRNLAVRNDDLPQLEERLRGVLSAQPSGGR
jgi:hypothetical protein